MRLGLVIGQLGYGGGESQLYELARALDRNHDVHVYCLSSRREPYGRLLEELGIPVRILPARGRLDASRVAALARALRADRVQIVHAFLFIASAYTYLATRFIREVVLVTSARNCKTEPSVLRRILIRRAFRASDAIIANSQQAGRFAEAHYGAPGGRIAVVYNGVDASRFTTAVEGHVYSSAKDGLTIGTVGRIEAQKNLDLLLDAAARVRRVRCDVRFEIVGEGSERARLEARVEAMGLDGAVRCVGTTDDVPRFFARLDQFWLTSDWEGTPNVVLEAMAAGVPVVATRVGGTSEVIEDGRNGILVERGDAEGLSAAALRLIESPEKAGVLARAARADTISRFSLERMVADTVEVYGRALEIGR